MTNDHFRDSIDLDFGDRDDIVSKEKLATLMRRRNYFNADTRKEGGREKLKRQTQALLDDAWEYLKESGVIK